MKCQCGIEGIFCVVRDNTEYDFGPQWFFTSPEIDTFLASANPAWDINVIAMDLEAFGIAGWDMFRKWRVSDDVAPVSHQPYHISAQISLQGSRRLDQERSPPEASSFLWYSPLFQQS